MHLSGFAIEQLFNYVPATADNDECWWREVVGGGEGYLIVWANGECHHTYHNPEVIFEDALRG